MITIYTIESNIPILLISSNKISKFMKMKSQNTKINQTSKFKQVSNAKINKTNKIHKTSTSVGFFFSLNWQLPTSSNLNDTSSSLNNGYPWGGCVQKK